MFKGVNLFKLNAETVREALQMWVRAQQAPTERPLFVAHVQASELDLTELWVQVTPDEPHLEELQPEQGEH